MSAHTDKKRALDAAAYFDRISSAGQFAGLPALALSHTAAKFSLPLAELREVISVIRTNEKAQDRP